LVVANPQGASGKIDILAEDRWTHRVVIEIKRSDKSAREAAHELFKYSDLLKRRNGLKDSELRILLLSTDWHELLVPFSAYARETAFQCEGYKLTVDSDGTIRGLQKVELLERPWLVDFIPHHVIWLFENSALRAAAVPTLTEKIRVQGITDFVLFLLDYHGPNPRVVFPFGIYSCLGAMPPKALDEFLGASDESIDSRQEKLTGKVFGSIAIDNATAEIGYPEKAAALQQEWKMQSASRHGRWLGTESIQSDDELWLRVASLDKGNAYFFEKFTSPRFRSEWTEMKNDAVQALLGAPNWQEFFLVYLDELQTKYPNADVGVSIDNTCDLIFGLYFLFAQGDLRYLPTLRINIKRGDSSFLHAFSSLTWSGKRLPKSIEQVLAKLFPRSAEYFDHRHFGKLHTIYPKLLAMMGLATPILEIRNVGSNDTTAEQLVVKKGKILRLAHTSSTPPGKSLLEFKQENEAFCQSLVAFVERETILA
jgi:hypothetical protein